MATNYPTSIDSFTNPTSGDTLDSPSHAAQHTNINDAMVAVQTRLGAQSGTIGAWTAYTPVWTGVGSNPAIGNGIIEGRYTRINGLVIVKVRVGMGSTTTYGSGRYDFSLPVNYANSTAFNTTFGTAWFNDSGSVTAYTGVTVAGPSASTVTFRIPAGGFGDVTNTAPFTFANGDAISFIATYEAA